jgi:hypothetical protein
MFIEQTGVLHTLTLNRQSYWGERMTLYVTRYDDVKSNVQQFFVVAVMEKPRTVTPYSNTCTREGNNIL